MIRGSRDFYLRKRADGSIAFRIKVPLDLRQAFGRSEIQIKIPHKDIIPQLGDCCRVHFSKLEEVAPMVEAFNPQKVRKVALLSSKEFTVWADTPAKRWLFPVLAYTGTRIEEICKLRKRDVRKQDDVWVIDINEDMGRNKNEHSTRLVPVHDKLLAMGLIKYAESLPDDDGSMLFPELECYRGKWSAQILKITNYFLHNTLGYGKGYSNHSLRHFANNELIKRGVRISVADQLLGRVQQGVGGQVYFKGHFMESLRDAINQIP